MMLPLFFSIPDPVRTGEYRVDFLDVGQGLAVVVRTANHTLLYDTGYSNDDGFDVGQRVIVPYLWHEGVDRLDHVVLSHDDRDHVGGYHAIRAEFDIGRLSVMPGSRFLQTGKNPSVCRAGDYWRWDQVEFRFLHPGESVAGRENNRSCVLSISGAGGRVMLTGDIEQQAESELISRYGNKLRSDILLAPHHGSATSSSAALIARVRPAEVVYSSGYRNRFGFPEAGVKNRYLASGAQQHNTAETGMLRFHFLQGQDGYRRIIYRQQHRQFR